MIRTLFTALTALLLTAGAANATTVVAVETDSIWDARDAGMMCNATAASSTWTGHWNTTQWARMSVCNCEVGTFLTARFDVEAGPIWNQRHAQRVCPQVCSSASWTGRFSTARRGGASSCDIAYNGHIQGAVRFVPSRPLPVRVAPRVVTTRSPHRQPVYRVPSRRGNADLRVVLGYPGRGRGF